MLKWISVQKRLPAKDVGSYSASVIVKTYSGDMTIAYVGYADGAWFSDLDGTPVSGVSHWCYIPVIGDENSESVQPIIDTQIPEGFMLT